MNEQPTGMVFLPRESRFTRATYLYMWRCSACGAKHEESRMAQRGNPVWIPPVVPEGWNVLDEAIFCPKHKVVHLVDGEVHA
jgi:hypothetical protein